MAKVFLNFRDGDESYAVPLVWRALAQRLGPDEVFWSRKSIERGTPFPRALVEAVERCEVLLAFIGPRWLTITDERGRRRLSQPQDWVRKEIALALRLGRKVIPIMLQGVPRLKPKGLPRSIAKLWLQQSFRLDTFDDNQLADIVDEVAAMAGAADVPAVSRPAWADMQPIWNVPAMPRNSVDRSASIASISEALQRGVRQRTGPVVLCGVPGAGKTWLAMEYAYRYAAGYELVWWIPGAPTEVVPGQLADLARLLGIEVPADLHLALPLLSGRLRQRGRWLLIFDDVDDPVGIRQFIPQGPDGHVLITSRNPDWSSVGERLVVDMFTRHESASLLQARLKDLADEDAERLAAAMGDLPLGVAQAAAFLDQSMITPERYLELLRTETGKLLHRGADEIYRRSLAATWSLAMDRLSKIDPGAASMAEFCAVFEASPIPLDVLSAAEALPPDLAGLVADVLDFDDALRAIRRSGLLEVTTEAVHAHRVLRDFLRDRLSSDRRATLHRAAARSVAARPPGDPRDPASWPRYRLILPHVLALDLVGCDEPACGWLLLDVAHFLLVNGDLNTSQNMLGDALERWRTPDVSVDLILEARAHLARTHFHAGRHTEALARDREVLRHLRGRFGQDHPETLTAWQNVAADLAAVNAGAPSTRRLHEELVGRWRSSAGDDHRGTLRAVHNLAAHLRTTGQPARARALDEQNLLRLRRVIGPDHVDTLASAAGLAADLRALGDYRSARKLDEDTFARRQHLFGPDHVDTLAAAHSLAIDRRGCGDPSGARELDEYTYAQRRRLLGEDHEATLRSGLALHTDLHAVGDAQAAHRLLAALQPGLRPLAVPPQETEVGRRYGEGGQ